MCGIVGMTGLAHPRHFIINGLKILSYRGYDSAGLAYLDNGIQIYKDKGGVEHLETIVPSHFTSSAAIGHTRWATHGIPNKNNSHPHISFHKKICLVHNGLIENYLEIKEMLTKKGYSFYGETDSEVIANLIEDYYLEEKDVLKSLNKAMKTIQGSYAIALICPDDENRIYLMKNGSPLVIGLGIGYNLLASDASSMIDLSNKFIDLSDKEYGYIEKDRILVLDKNGIEVQKQFVYKDIEMISHDLKGYPHYMLKEIEEIEPVVNRLVSHYYVDGHYNFDDALLNQIRESDHIILIGCGTSYHASLIGGRYLENIGISTTKYIASEWAYHPTFPGKKPFIILISQSGETADLIHCSKVIQEYHLPTLLITNTSGSTLDRACQFSLLLHAGVEISVASTKAYVAQVTLFALLMGALNNNRQVIKDIQDSLEAVRFIKNNCKERIQEIAQTIKDKQDIYYLGRGYDYFLSLEASLKLKEVSYIHSEAIPGGELKHGPIALIEKNTPVIVFISDPVSAKGMRSNIEEVKSRGAKVFTIVTTPLARDDDTIVINEYAYYLSSVTLSSVAFYLAYYTSLAKGLDVDKPRNLAKSVTVE